MVAILSVILAMLLSTGLAAAHAVAEGDKGYIQEITGVHLLPFVYLGAKHMVTGYDHLLFLLGVIFFLYRLQHIAIYVSLFAIGHSTTMIMGVYFGWNVSSYLIDAIIGLSVVYKALDNLGAFQRWLGYQPNTKLATLIFGFFHGLGLATKILEYD
ncbi:MAG: HupE/UreJ family protein, partial [Mesorhizobium sp.]